MKKIIALLLVCSFLTACAPKSGKHETQVPDASSLNLNFSGVSDPALLDYIEDAVYSGVVSNLNSADYFVENVKAVFVSKEYLEELEYNSKANIFFGYTLAELDAQFEDTKYIFTLGEDGQTAVKEFEPYDDTFDKVIKNVAIGAGVILLCVTVSAVTGGLGPGAAAVSSVFAMAAKGAATLAASTGLISGVTSGVVTGIATKDFNKALKAAALQGSEGFKWGAVTGAISGGVGQAVQLHGATLNGLTMNQAAEIQKKSGWSLSIIKNISSRNEYDIYEQAGLTPLKMPDGKWALIQKIDWHLTDNDGHTNIERVMKYHLSPIDSTDTSIHLHHIGQKADSPLAILTKEQHQNYYKNLHVKGRSKDVSDAVWKQQREAFWKMICKMQTGGH